MSRTAIIFSMLVCLALAHASVIRADVPHPHGHPCSIWNRQSLTNGFCGLCDKLKGCGIEVGLGVTNISQQNVHGGLSKHRRAGRLAGSYDLGVEAHLQKLLGLDGARVFVHAEGWWSRSGGIDGTSVGSMFGTNGDAGARDAIVVTELWYEQSMMDGRLFLRLGKMDLTGGFECSGCPVAFDSSRFAGDETTQFLNGALVNNPTIPFPDYTLGVAVFYSPLDQWYISAAATDAQNDLRETGFSTALRDEDYFFYILETGVTPKVKSTNGPLQGAYRLGLWNDAQPKANSDAARTYRDDTGFYVSCDQMLTKENDEPEDCQGLGIFARYGCANSRRSNVTNFWSMGFQYRSLIEGRDDDVLGAGFARGFFSDKAAMTYHDDSEAVLEAYYNAQVTPWLNVSPSIQYIANPGAAGTTSDAVVLGLRAQMLF